MYDTDTNMFAKKAHISTPAHFVTNADGTDAIPLNLAEFTTASSSDECGQNAVGQLGHAGTAFTLSKEGTTCKYAPIDETL